MAAEKAAGARAVPDAATIDEAAGARAAPNPQVAAENAAGARAVPNAATIDEFREYIEKVG